MKFFKLFFLLLAIMFSYHFGYYKGRFDVIEEGIAEFTEGIK